MAQHPDNDAIDDWIEANCDLEGWVWDGDFDDLPSLRLLRRNDV
jgi:hypothetical protein